MRQYKYRLTITFSSSKQWILGVEVQSVGEDVARELASHAGDFQHACLSLEKTGKVIWLRKGTEFQH
jgi:hypothetical protein